MSSAAGQNFTPTNHRDTYPLISEANHAGHAVLISGASKGIGRATALAFARSGAATVILAARSGLQDLADEIAQLHPATKVICVSLDVTSEESVAAALAAVGAQVSSIDILINNAGYLEEPKPLKESDPKEWWRTCEVNLKGTYLVVHAFLGLVLASEAKTIINVSSKGGLYTRHGSSAYGTSKAAVLRLTEFLDAEYGGQGLLALAVHPGSVMTELAMRLGPEAHGVLVDTPQLAADTLAWLTQERRAWLGGRYVSVSWDMGELVAQRDEIVRGNKLKLALVI